MFGRVLGTRPIWCRIPLFNRITNRCWAWSTNIPASRIPVFSLVRTFADFGTAKTSERAATNHCKLHGDYSHPTYPEGCAMCVIKTGKRGPEQLLQMADAIVSVDVPMAAACTWAAAEAAVVIFAHREQGGVVLDSHEEIRSVCEILFRKNQRHCGLYSTFCAAQDWYLRRFEESDPLEVLGMPARIARVRSFVSALRHLKLADLEELHIQKCLDVLRHKYR